MKAFKSVIAGVLVICLILGGVSIPEVAKAETTTTFFIGEDSSINDTQYVIRLIPNDERVTVEPGTPTVLIDGQEASEGVTWTYDENGYSLCIAFSAVESGMKNNTYIGTHYITIPAGNTIGDVVLEEDLYIKLVGGGMASDETGNWLVEKVPEIPKGFYLARMRYTDGDGTNGRYLFYFGRADGVEVPAFTGKKSQSIYVDGTLKSFQWEYSEGMYYVTVRYSALDSSVTAVENMGMHLIKVPTSVKLADTTLFFENLYFRIEADNVEMLTETFASLQKSINYNDNTNAKYYTFAIKPDDGRYITDTTKYITTSHETAEKHSWNILVDGEEVSNGIFQWVYYQDNYTLCVKYTKIESGASNASEVGEHIVTIPEGTCIGEMVLKGSVSFYVHGRTIRQVTAVELDDPNSSYHDGNQWYTMWLKPADKKIVSDLVGTKTTVYVDGVEQTGVWADSNSDQICLIIRYSTLEPGVIKASEIGKHFIMLPAGTDIGGRETANDIWAQVDGDSLEVVEPDEADFYYGTYNNNGTSYYIYIKPSDANKTVTDVGSYSTIIYLDGRKLNSGIAEWFVREGSGDQPDSYCARILYETIEAGVTTAAGMESVHGIIIPKGTCVGDMLMAEDVYIRIDDGNVRTTDTFTFPGTTTTRTETITPVTLNYAGVSTDASADGYTVSFAVEGATVSLDATTSANIRVNGTIKTDATITYTKSSDTIMDIFVPCSVINSEASSISDITERYLLTIPRGVVIGDMVMKREMSFMVMGNSVKEIVNPIVTLETDTHENNQNTTEGFDEQKVYFSTTPDEQLEVGKSYSFSTYGVYVEGKQRPDLQVKKEAAGLYSVELTDVSVVDEMLIWIRGNIQPTSYSVGFETIYLQYEVETGWELYMQLQYTTVTTKNDTRNGARDMKGIYVITSSDPLEKEAYMPQDFVWGSGRHGGIYLNGKEITGSNIYLEKQWDKNYYIDLNRVNVKAGDIVSLHGSICVEQNVVTFPEISFIKNKDGSFSQYDASVSETPAKEVVLADIYVNLDERGAYSIPNTPLVQGNDVTIIVNGTVTTDNQLTSVGTYQVERVMENAVHARAVDSVFGDITYTQNIHVFKTGDAKNDGDVTVADLVNMKKNIGKIENAVGAHTDLNYDTKVTETDCTLLMDLLVENITPQNIIESDQSVVIGTISDTHYMASGRDGQNRINTIKALNYYKSQNVDVIIFNADITDYGETTAYQELVEDIKAVYPDETTRPKMIFTGDNHEWYDAWDGINGHVATATFDEVQERFCTQLSELRENSTDTNTHYEVNGYHFIGVTSDGMNGGYATYDDDTTVKWVEETLAAAAADDTTRKKPIFLAIHQAPENTVNTSTGSDHFDTKETKLKEVLAQYPQLVIFTSHSHAPLQDEKSIYQGAYTVLNTASVYYAGTLNTNGRIDNVNESDKTSVIYEFGQGLLIRANGNSVDVERRDFYNDETIKTNWTFKTSDNVKDYTNSRTDTSAPTFSGTLSAAWSSNTEATLTFAGAADDDYISHYIVEVYKNNSTTATKILEYSSLFFLGLNSARYNNQSIKVKDLDSKVPYTFKVKAVDAWGNTSITDISSTLGAKTQ